MKTAILLSLLYFSGVFSQCPTTDTRSYSRNYPSLAKITVKNPLGGVSFCRHNGPNVDITVAVGTSAIVSTPTFASDVLTLVVSMPDETSGLPRTLPGASLSLLCLLLACVAAGKRKFGACALFAALIPLVLAADACASVVVRLPSSLVVGSFEVEDSRGRVSSPSAPPCEAPSTTGFASTASVTSGVATTAAATTAAPTTAIPTTAVATTGVPTTAVPTTAVPTTRVPTTAVPTTAVPTTRVPTTGVPTTAVPTTAVATTAVRTTGVPTTGVPTTGSGVIRPVAFRLDDIQDYWITPAQKAVINAFRTRNLPMSIGIIANLFGRDSDILSFVRTAIAGTPHIDVMDHGYNHEDFSTFTLSQQTNLLKWAKLNISQALGVVTQTFMPPFNAINPNTITALTANNFTLLSSEVSQDPPPYNFNNPQLWKFHIAAQTAELVGSLYKGVPYTVTLNQINAQLNTFGFAAVMMHPQEFSNYVGGQYVNQVNNTQLNELNLLLTELQRQGVTFCALDQLKNYAYLYRS